MQQNRASGAVLCDGQRDGPTGSEVDGAGAGLDHGLLSVTGLLGSQRSRSPPRDHALGVALANPVPQLRVPVGIGVQTVDREAADFVAARTALLPAAPSQTTFFAAGQPNPGNDSRPVSGPRMITCNLTLDFATFG